MYKLAGQFEFPPAAACVKGLCPFETHHLLKKVDENFNLKTFVFSISSAVGWFASAVWQLFKGLCPFETHNFLKKLSKTSFLFSYYPSLRRRRMGNILLSV